MAGLLWTPNKANSSKTAETTNNQTDLHTGKIDILISEIARLKATPQSAERDSQIQALVAQRNALLTEGANHPGWY